MRSSERSARRASWRRTWLLPIVMLAGRRLALYLALYPIHLALAGVALAYVAVKAGTGDADWIFWLSYGWVALQVLVGPRLFVPTALALAFVALQATQGDRDAIFWACFAWLALMILSGGVLIKATRAKRKRARARAQAESGPGLEAVLASLFGQQGSNWPHTAQSEASGSDDTIEGTAHEVTDELVDELERLARLRESGALSDDEFEAAKRKLLG